MTDPKPPPKHPWIQMYEDWKASPDNETFARIREKRQAECEHVSQYVAYGSDGSYSTCTRCGKWIKDRP